MPQMSPEAKQVCLIFSFTLCTYFQDRTLFYNVLRSKNEQLNSFLDFIYRLES